MTTYVNSVQQVTITITAGTSNTATISSVGANAFIIYGGFTSVGTGTDGATSQPTVVLTNSTTVTATINSSGTVTIVCTVIDPTSSLVTSIQAGTIVIGAAAGSNTATITSVTLANSAVFYLGTLTTDTTGGSSSVIGSSGVQLTNATTVTATRGTTSAFTSTISYVVVQFAGAALNSSTQQKQIVLTTGTSATTSITSVTVANTILAWGGCITTVGTDATLGYVTLTSSTVLTLTVNTTSVTTDAAVGVIEFVAGVLKSNQTGTIALSSATSNTATITAVNTSYSVVNYLGETGTGTTDATTNLSLTLTNGTTVTANLNTAGSATTSYDVFEFNAPIFSFPFLIDKDNISGGMQRLNGGFRANSKDEKIIELELIGDTYMISPKIIEIGIIPNV